MIVRFSHKKVLFLVSGVSLIALYFSTEDQEAKKFPVIGMVVSNKANAAAFQQGLRDLGYTDGQNLRIEYRHSEGKLDRIPGLVSELIERKVDLLFLENQVALRAAKKMTKTTPIVMVSSV